MIVALALAACSRGGDAGTLEDGLKQPLSRIYGPIESVTCEESDTVTIPGGGTAYDCTLNLERGGTQVVCAGRAKGVPLFERTPCNQSRFPSR